MAEKVTLRLSAFAAALVRRDASKTEKLQAAHGEIQLVPADFGNLLLVLSHDPDPDIRAAAAGSLRDMPESLRNAVASAPGTHPKVIELLSSPQPLIVPFTDESSPPTSTENSSDMKDVQETFTQPMEPGADTMTESIIAEASIDEEDVDGEIDTTNEESDEFKSKYKLCMELDTSAKIKYAMTGDKEWRSILIKDNNKLVSGAVIKNPRISEGEVLTFAKSKIQNDEILRIICMNKDWLKNYQIRKALVENAKTPLPKALRFMSTLTEKDLNSLAKSKNVSSAIATQARRISMTRK